MIFSQRDKAEMRVASDFRWRSEKTFITEGVTQNLTAEVFDDWLNKIFPKYTLVECEGCGNVWDTISPCALCNVDLRFS